MGRCFAVVPVPVRDTVLGGLTADVPESRVHAVALFEHGDGQPRYHVDLVATGFDAMDIRVARRRLREVFTVLLEIEPGPERWHARGRVPLNSITSRALRVLGAGGSELAPPWVEIEGGIACIRLRPRGRDADGAFRDALQGRLEACGVTAPVRLEDVDDGLHDDHRRCLQDTGVATASQVA